MTLFRWGKDGKPPDSPDLAIPGDASASPAGGTSPASDSAAANIFAERKTRRDKGVRRGARGEKLSEGEAQIIATFEKLYAPEVWEGVVCAPADTMLAISGRKLWEISNRERTTLSVTASMTARCFAVENPKWLALIMLSITLAQIYGTRAMMHMHETAEERKRAKQEPRATGEDKK